MPPRQLNIARHPLTDKELRLIEMAEQTVWLPGLRSALAGACAERGITVGPYEHCGDLAECLTMVAHPSR